MEKSSRLVFLKFFLWLLIFLLSLRLVFLSLYFLSLFLVIIPAFFSSENEKKLSSEVSALKAKLDLYQADMEIERQKHQEEEKALRARVVEAEKQRDAAAQEALKNVEAMKKECSGIASSFSFPFLFKFPFLLTCFFVAWSSSPS